MPEIIHTWYESDSGCYVIAYDDGTVERVLQQD
jgi:hypothetical protein